jgi:hypothetical protein
MHNYIYWFDANVLITVPIKIYFVIWFINNGNLINWFLILKCLWSQIYRQLYPELDRKLTHTLEATHGPLYALVRQNGRWVSDNAYIYYIRYKRFCRISSGGNLLQRNLSLLLSPKNTRGEFNVIKPIGMIKMKGIELVLVDHTSCYKFLPSFPWVDSFIAIHHVHGVLASKLGARSFQVHQQGH